MTMCGCISGTSPLIPVLLEGSDPEQYQQHLASELLYSQPCSGPPLGGTCAPACRRPLLSGIWVLPFSVMCVSCPLCSFNYVREESTAWGNRPSHHAQCARWLSLGDDFSREQCEAEVPYEGFSLGFFPFTLATSDDIIEILFICSTH